jgi:hypothetical protein
MHLTEGDRVRIDIPDRDDPDFERFHGEQGVIVDILDDNAETETGDTRDSQLYRVELDMGETMDFRWRDLRPM